VHCGGGTSGNGQVVPPWIAGGPGSPLHQSRVGAADESLGGPLRKRRAPHAGGEDRAKCGYGAVRVPGQQPDIRKKRKHRANRPTDALPLQDQSGHPELHVSRPRLADGEPAAHHGVQAQVPTDSVEQCHPPDQNQLDGAHDPGSGHQW